MGALLKPTHQEGGGFHIYGDSSKGKSTGMAVACSVFGDETFKQSWRATSNGLEAASLSCKSLNAPYSPNKGIFNILMD
jgi:putative DNA primase/helicase